MATSLNKAMLIGHLGDYVKMHHFNGGGSIGRFPLATSYSYKKKDGTKVDETEWHNIVVRNKAAEICEKYLKKGDKIFVEGRIKQNVWEDNDGNKRYTTEIHADNFNFLNTKGSGESKPGSTTNAAAPTRDDLDPEQHDDLPF